MEFVLSAVSKMRLDKQRSSSPGLEAVICVVEDCPASPAYFPPEMELDEDFLWYECTECGTRRENKFELFQHLEEDHGVQDDEDILNSKVKGIKANEEGDSAAGKTDLANKFDNSDENHRTGVEVSEEGGAQ